MRIELGGTLIVAREYITDKITYIHNAIDE